MGTALVEGMKHAFEVIVYDKKSPDYTVRYEKGHPLEWQALEIEGSWPKQIVDWVNNSLSSGVIFVCVPTPMTEDGSCDTSIVESIVDELAKVAPSGATVCIKSTIVPGTTARLNEKHKNINVCYNPEFLREATYIEDFKKQDRIIVGGPEDGTKAVKELYQEAYPDVPVIETNSTVAEMVKYITNCFLAVKVSFANEIKLLCDSLNIDYDKVIEYATKDNRLGSSHWSVPGPDGKSGFGLTCFPKDLNAIMALCKELEIAHNTMSGAWDTNLHVRPERDWEIKGRSVT